MAVSANGMIATIDGKEDFLSSDNWDAFAEHVDRVGNIIWGHNTYKQVITWPSKYLDSLSSAVKVIISHDNSVKLDPRFVLASSPEEAISILEKKGFSEVIVTGGSTNNTEFAKRKLINEVFLTVDSVIIGEGLPLFKPEDFQLNLELIEMQKITNKIISLRYKVI